MKAEYKQYRTQREYKAKFMGETVIVPKGALCDNRVYGGCYEDVRIWIDYPKDHHLAHDLNYRGLRVPLSIFMTDKELLHQ